LAPPRPAQYAAYDSSQPDHREHDCAREGECAGKSPPCESSGGHAEQLVALGRSENGTNRELEDGEQCDDGNTENGDGCSESCQVEPGFQCSIPDYACVSLGACGDGIVNPYGERCDDGNAVGGDGCSADCTAIEPGYVCHTPGLPCEQISVVHPHCGDGLVQPEYGEACDDGINDGSLGGCAADCMLPYCGDGQVQPEYGEVCDDGINGGGYGRCGADCTLAPLPASPDCSRLERYCGDGVLQADYEECDDGANNGRNGHCELDCTLRRGGYCGDGVVDVGYEECDDGNWVSCDGCSSMCQRETAVP
jgi:cysteine-rich repeat protein